MTIFDHSPKNITSILYDAASHLNDVLLLIELKSVNPRLSTLDASCLRDIQYRSLKLLEVYESQETEQGVLNEREEA